MLLDALAEAGMVIQKEEQVEYLNFQNRWLTAFLFREDIQMSVE